MTDYRPIDCRSYAEFERAIVGRRQLRVCWQDPDGLDHLETVTPLDLETCRGEEFLHARTEAGETLRLRLDRIRRARTLPPGGASADG